MMNEFNNKGNDRLAAHTRRYPQTQHTYSTHFPTVYPPTCSTFWNSEPTGVRPMRLQIFVRPPAAVPLYSQIMIHPNLKTLAFKSCFHSNPNTRLHYTQPTLCTPIQQLIKAHYGVLLSQQKFETSSVRSTVDEMLNPWSQRSCIVTCQSNNCQ